MNCGSNKKSNNPTYTGVAAWQFYRLLISKVSFLAEQQAEFDKASGKEKDNVPSSGYLIIFPVTWNEPVTTQDFIY